MMLKITYVLELFRTPRAGSGESPVQSRRFSRGLPKNLAIVNTDFRNSTTKEHASSSEATKARLWEC